MIDPNRLGDLIRKAENNGLAHTKFLTPAEAEEVRRSFGAHNQSVRLEFISGFEDGERCAAVFVNADWGAYEPDEIIAAVKISHRKQDEIGHRDILGAALALGISRELLGDIIAGDCCFLVCLESIAGFIAHNLDKVGRHGVKTEIIPIDQLPKASACLEEHTDTIASLRLDCVVSAMFNISRSLSAEYITRGKAQLRHMLCEKPDKEVEPGDIISIRGLGRARLLETGGKSRKSRTWIKYGKYI